MSDVRRPEEPLRVAAGQRLLSAGWSGAPQVREVEVVVALPPHRHERLLAPDEERRSTVAQALLDLGQVSACSTYVVDHSLVAAHLSDVRGAAGRAGMLPFASAPLAQLAEQLTLNQRVRGSSP